MSTGENGVVGNGQDSRVKAESGGRREEAGREGEAGGGGVLLSLAPDAIRLAT